MRKRTVLCCMALLALTSVGTWAQPICDAALQPVSDARNGYQSRSEKHCEGFYREAQSGASIFMVGYLYGKLRADDREAVELTVDQRTTFGGPIRLRATPFALKTYYRMDAQLSSADQTFLWPLDLFKANERLKTTDVSVMAWYTEEGRQVYLPLRIDEQEGQTLRVYCKTFSDLKNIRFSLFREDQPDEQGWQTPTFTSADAGSAIVINLRGIAPGRYQFQLSGTGLYDNKPAYSRVVQLRVF